MGDRETIFVANDNGQVTPSLMRFGVNRYGLAIKEGTEYFSLPINQTSGHTKIAE